MTCSRSIVTPGWRVVLVIMFSLVLGSSATSIQAAPLATFSSPIGGSGTSSLIPRVWIPVVLKNYPPVKVKSGIHLGNRLLLDWDTSTIGAYDYLWRLKGTDFGMWPSAIVVQSNQVYNIRRSASGNCPVLDATILRPKAFEFMKQAALKGTRIIIRIKPSPGNFYDALGSGLHLLITSPGVTPQNQPYCYDPIPGDGKYTAADYFRAIDDVAAEMNAIHSLNGSNGFSEFAFEPANEPNNEWFSGGQTQGYVAWQGMDAYFSALYDYVHSNYPGISVLTPPMAQGNYAETRNFACGSMSVFLGQSGYDLMQTTYTAKNDGYSWHNYWKQSREFWAVTGDPCPTSNHVFQYFPQWLQTEITSSGKPSFITEADLLSPCQASGNSITDKDLYSSATQESIWRFISEERGANHVVAWLLTESPHFTQGCAPGIPLTDYLEIKWHEAYKEEGLERSWFAPWWLRPEQ